MTRVRPTHVRYLVLGALCAAAAIAYLQRSCMGVVATTMRGEWGLSVHQMGDILSGWLVTYALFQIPAGRLGDILGSRRALPLFCFLWSVATILTAVTTWYWALLAVRLVFGAAQAGLFPCSAIILKQWFPEEKRGMATGWVAAFQQLGGVIGALLAGQWLGLYLGLWQPEWTVSEKVVIPKLPSVVASLSESGRETLKGFVPWTGMFYAFALPGVLWSIWFLGWFRDRPADHPAVNAEELALLPGGKSSNEPITSPDEASASRETVSIAGVNDNVWRAMLTSPTMWLICAQQFCRAFGYIFFLSWFPTFLEKTRHVTVQKSGMFTALTLGAALVGALAGGAISDSVLARTGSRRWAKQGVAFLALLGASLFAACAYFVNSAEAAVAVLCIGSFLASVAGPASYSVTIDVAGRHTATVFGTMNMAGNIGAAIFPWIVPKLLTIPERFGWNFSGWDLVLFVFAAIYAVAAACWIFLNPNGTIFGEEKGS